MSSGVANTPGLVEAPPAYLSNRVIEQPGLAQGVR